jgi:hypothetical protein
VPDGCPRLRGQLDPLSQLGRHLSGVVEIHGGRIGLRGCGRRRRGYVRLGWARSHGSGCRRRRGGWRRSRGGRRCWRRRLDRRWDCRRRDRTRRRRNPPRRAVGLAHRSVTAHPGQRGSTTEVWRLKRPGRRDKFHSDGGDHPVTGFATRAGKLEGQSEDPNERKRTRRGQKPPWDQWARHVTAPELSTLAAQRSPRRRKRCDRLQGRHTPAPLPPSRRATRPRMSSAMEEPVDHVRMKNGRVVAALAAGLRHRGTVTNPSGFGRRRRPRASAELRGPFIRQGFGSAADKGFDAHFPQATAEREVADQSRQG